MPITFWRRVVQAAFFGLFVYGGWVFVSVTGGLTETGPIPQGSILWTQGHQPMIDAFLPGAVCRFTGRGKAASGCIVELLSEWLTIGRSVRTLLPYLLIFMVLAFMAARLWCGWACPLGALGDTLNWLRVKFRRRSAALSPRLQSALRSTSYSVLGATLGLSLLIRPARFKSTYQCWFFLPFCQICPARLACPLAAAAAPTSWGGFGHAIQAGFTIASWAVLGFFVVAFLSARRLWCHVCPMGLVNSWFNRGGAVVLAKDAMRCNRCGACADACPMGLTHVRDEKDRKNMNVPECIFCLRCVEQCPRDGCLSFRFLGLTVKQSVFKSENM